MNNYLDHSEMRPASHRQASETQVTPVHSEAIGPADIRISPADAFLISEALTRYSEMLGDETMRGPRSRVRALAGLFLDKAVVIGGVR